MGRRYEEAVQAVCPNQQSWWDVTTYLEIISKGWNIYMPVKFYQKAKLNATFLCKTGLLATTIIRMGLMHEWELQHRELAA